jgi:hypothetical protein
LAYLRATLVDRSAIHVAILAASLALVATLLLRLDRSLPHGRDGWRARISTAFAGIGSELGELNLARPAAVDELKSERLGKLKAARAMAEKAEMTQPAESAGRPRTAPEGFSSI